jgi:hypothetical protein
MLEAASIRRLEPVNKIEMESGAYWQWIIAICCSWGTYPPQRRPTEETPIATSGFLFVTGVVRLSVLEDNQVPLGNFAGLEVPCET